MSKSVTVNKHWNNLDQFPPSNFAWEVLRKGKITAGKNAVISTGKNWFISQRELVAAPNSEKFLPAICIPEISNQVHENFLRKYKYVFLVLGAGLIVSSVLAGFAPNPFPLLRAALLFLICLIYSGLEYHYVFKNYPTVVERTLFFYSQFNHWNKGILVLLLLVLFGGLAQIGYQNFAGNFEDLVTRFGVFYPEIDATSYWRFLIGPFIHSGMLHWFVNFAILSLALKLIGNLANTRIVLLGIASIPITAFTVYIFSDPGLADGFVGVSGMVFCILGWLVSVSYRNKNFFPSLFFFSVLTLTLINLLIPEVLNINSSFIAHISGFLLGVIAGMFRFAENIPCETDSKKKS